MPESPREPYRALVLSVTKHDYIATAVASHRRFDLVAVADDPQQPQWVHQRNHEFANRFDIPYVTDVSAAIQRHRPDLAIISSAAERHCDLAIRAADAGLHVIVDKPLSTRLAECDRLVEAIERNDVRCLIWNRNLQPALLQAKHEIESGSIGELRAVHCDFYFSKDAGPAKGTRGETDPPINWLQRQIEAHADGSDGGVGTEAMGELQVEGIYPLAYLRMLTGRRVQRVFARTASHFHQAHVDNGVDDLAAVSLEMAGGLAGSLCLGRIGAASHPNLGDIRLHLIGSLGSLVIREPLPEVPIHYRDQPASEFKHIGVGNECDFLLVEQFAESMDTAVDTLLDARAGRDICAIIEACLRSAETGQIEVVE